MTTERMTVTAADLQPGDVVVEATWTKFTVDRPVLTVCLTFDVPESKREAVEQAVQRVLDPPVKVGDRVRRTLPHGEGDGNTGWQYEPGATGVVTYLYLSGDAAVDVDSEGGDRVWRAGSFEVVPS